MATHRMSQRSAGSLNVWQIPRKMASKQYGQRYQPAVHIWTARPIDECSVSSWHQCSSAEQSSEQRGFQSKRTQAKIEAMYRVCIRVALMLSWVTFWIMSWLKQTDCVCLASVLQTIYVQLPRNLNHAIILNVKLFCCLLWLNDFAIKYELEICTLFKDAFLTADLAEGFK